ncbi:DegT/DnrJ/EryC1/StrS family aminotransferase [Gemmata sp. JC717]|uniref:DegT/DnrJ/EryC1/StrS family aminotransferase n=1 Tax=Gemmata algarum TaxID=2975278 RepID=UPI0021BA434B|nr:DegT/DnrJ/EryC1/StrS family aminotransferase [Gemmata algarum]MDY3554356.1 DegT/DnrJ/EryC1/StrS family aminotransferase [Gemmata algarum]
MPPTVPFNDLHPRFAAAAAEYRAAVERVLGRAWYVLGPEVEAFEQAFAAYHGGGHAVGVANGTDAIELALRAAGVGPGDEVVTVAHTAVATACGVERSGARPVFADIRADDYTLDAAALAAAITPRTRAVVAVHLYGQAARLTDLRAVADRHNLLLIEDCAQAHGARDEQGRRVGTVGDLAAFSFYPTKNLGAFGDGGAVLARDPALAARARRLRNYGQTDRYHHADPGGFNSRLDEIQAAMLTVALGRLDADNAERNRLAERYLGGLALADLPHPRPGCEHTYHLFVARVPGRDAFRSRLAARGVQTLIHYPVPVHLQPAYAHLGGREGDLPETERAAREVVSLPLFVGLTDAQQDAVIAAVNADSLAHRPAA